MQRLNEDIKTGQLKNLYLLYGEEAYLRRQYKDRLKSAIIGDDDMKIAIASEGTIEVEKKKSVKVKFDELKFDLNDYGDAVSIGLSGEYYVEGDADVSMPKGDKFNVLTDKESDWEALAEELEGVMETLEDLMGSMY